MTEQATELQNNITGKIVFITGASSGLGEATARHLAARGAKMVIAARRKERLDKIAAEIREAGGEALPLILDMTEPYAVKAAAERAAEHYGRLDVMVNNAGVLDVAPLRRLHISAWNQMIDINIKGVLHGIAAALPIFEKQNSGHFITISSLAGRRVWAHYGTVYSGTKFAVCAISEGLRQETSDKIRVTIIEPGIAQSEITAGNVDEACRDSLAKAAKKALPADSVARAVAYAIEQPATVEVNEILLQPAEGS